MTRVIDIKTNLNKGSINRKRDKLHNKSVATVGHTMNGIKMDHSLPVPSVVVVATACCHLHHLLLSHEIPS